MKQIDKSLSDWLAHQPLQPLLLKLLALCDVVGLYIVDRDQQVIHWSQGMEQLTGLKTGDITGKACLSEYAITGGDEHKKQLIKSSQAGGYTIELEKINQAFV